MTETKVIYNPNLNTINPITTKKQKYKDLCGEIAVDCVILMGVICGIFIFGIICGLFYKLGEIMYSEPVISIIVIFILILGVFIIHCIRKNKITIVNPIRYNKHIDESPPV